MDRHIILYNITVEVECVTYGGNFNYYFDHLKNDPSAPIDNSNDDFKEFTHKRHYVNKQIHQHFQQDLIKHI